MALVGLAGTAVISILGSGLDTEFAMPATDDTIIVDDGSAAIYNHWIGTIPWLWTLVGLAGLAIFVAARSGAVPRWLGIVGLVLGGLTVVLGVSPLEYMAGVTGVLWLLVTAVGFTVGDRSFRRAPAAPDDGTDSDTTVGRVPRGPGRPWPRPAQCPGARARTERRWAALVLPLVAVGLLVVTIWLDARAPRRGPRHRAGAGLRLAVRRDRAGVRGVLRGRASP